MSFSVLSALPFCFSRPCFEPSSDFLRACNSCRSSARTQPWSGSADHCALVFSFPLSLILALSPRLTVGPFPFSALAAMLMTHSASAFRRPKTATYLFGCISCPHTPALARPLAFALSLFGFSFCNRPPVASRIFGNEVETRRNNSFKVANTATRSNFMSITSVCLINSSFKH